MIIRNIDKDYKRGTIVGFRSELEALARAINKLISSTHETQVTEDAVVDGGVTIKVICEAYKK